MSGERFTLDTNILVYVFDTTAGVRQRLARRVVDLALAGDCWLTLQSVSELYSVSTRKGRVATEVAASRAEHWLNMFPCLAASAVAVRTALSSSMGRRASYWDALLIATAAEGGCKAVLTEDQADGSVLAGVTVVNPFGPDELTDAARTLLSA